MGHSLGFVGFVGFIGFSAETDFIVNEGVLGFGPNSRVTLRRSQDCPVPGDEEMARLEFAAAGVSRERRVIRRAGAPISTLARRV